MKMFIHPGGAGRYNIKNGGIPFPGQARSAGLSFLADKYLEMKVLNVKQNMKVERQACITVRLRDYIAE